MGRLGCQSSQVLDGLTRLSEPRNLDRSTWPQQPSSLEGRLDARAENSRWVDLAARADKSRRVD